MNRIILAFIIMAVTTTFYLDIKKTQEKIQSDISISNNVIRFLEKSFDPNTGYLSRNNEFCSKLGYWDDVSLERVLKCTKLEKFYIFVKDETDEEKSYLRLSSNINLYLQKNTSAKSFKLIIKLDKNNSEDKRTLKTIAKSIREKYKIYIEDDIEDSDDLKTTFIIEI